MEKDPWKHRSTGMRCRTCMWFVEKASDSAMEAPKESKLMQTIGRCRRHAPTMSGYPVVYESDWCGDHKLNNQ